MFNGSKYFAIHTFLKMSVSILKYNCNYFVNKHAYFFNTFSQMLNFSVNLQSVFELQVQFLKELYFTFAEDSHTESQPES